MIKITLIALIIFCAGINSQLRLQPLKQVPSFQLKAQHRSDMKLSVPSRTKTAIPFLFYTMLFINPMLVVEDKRAYFGLTKEVSFGYYPAGRLAFEYSFIARDVNTSHLRFSYNYDIVLEARDFGAFVLTPGAGYFTDTNNKGWFGHVSAGLIIPAMFMQLNPYLRYRHTFVQDKPAGKTDIDDISLGMGFMFYLNGL